MSTLSELAQALRAGAKGSPDVLHDHLVEAGFPSEAVRTFVHDALLGISEAEPTLKAQPSPTSYTLMRPWVLYYQTALDLNGRSTNLFGALLPPVVTNFETPRRLLSGCAFKLRRVSASLVDGQYNWLRESGRLLIRINRVPVVDVLLNALLERGPWGVPADWDISDHDDIDGTIYHTGQTDTTVRVDLHGILHTLEG